MADDGKSMVHEDAVKWRMAYDLLKLVFGIVFSVMLAVIVIMALVIYDANFTIKLNNKRYEEMRQAHEVQSIYFNNMKARIEAMNLEKKKDD